MDICIISDLYPPEVIGGAEKHAHADASTLVEKGHSVNVITTGADIPLSHIRRSFHDGVDVHRFEPFNLYPPYHFQDVPSWKKALRHGINLWNPHATLSIKEILGRVDPDIIHIHNYRGFSTGVFKAAASVGVPTIHTLHDYASIHLRSNLFADGEPINPGKLAVPYYRYNDTIISRYVDMIIAPSQFIIDKHRELGMFKDVPCRRVQLGSTSTITEEPDDGTSQNTRLNLLYVGQHTYEKGVDLLIDAVGPMKEKGVKLDILGEGPETESLKEQAKQYEHVTVHGFVSEEKLERKYHQADYTVVPSRWYDNSPMVIYESFAHNTPVIGADIGGIPELVDHGKRGYLFTPDDRKDLRTTIQENMAESTRLTDNVKNWDRSLEDHVEELEGLYRELTG
ncbi:glycosyltransferase [Haloferax sp. AS1]|uniref:glycosyltransferase family 4 protein n=1 Tax=Haloferax sp. AS1 TaxID=2562277 RepID=UPI00165F79B4|nr:glycosyltransferase family 4 protein [Haloferax sp. AS1]MBC9986799.1 glycosyltransferase [Haloferax sp. AS1]